METIRFFDLLDYIASIMNILDGRHGARASSARLHFTPP